MKEVRKTVKKVDEKEKIAEKNTVKQKTVKEEVIVAKAGKRSTKAVKESEEKQAKEERKKSASHAEETRAKANVKPPRSRLERRGKKYREVAKLIDETKQYTLSEALDLAIKTSTTKFDSSVELHVKLNVDPKLSDQNVRGNVVLPAGTGKELKVAVFTEEAPTDLKKAGADIVGNEDFLTQLDKEKIDFDILITAPQMMGKLAKYARVLGPRGLMPNPKSGTVATDLKKAITQAKGGRVEFRVDSTGIVHLAIGKVSFGADKLNQNAETVIKAIKAAKPGSIKGAYVRAIYITTTMGPSVHVKSSGIK